MERQDVQVTLKFRQRLEFHDCMKYLAEAKSQITLESTRLQEQLNIVYARHFPAWVSFTPAPSPPLLPLHQQTLPPAHEVPPHQLPEINSNSPVPMP